MNSIAIILITLIFGFIIFNISNNKKISFLSTLLLIALVIYYIVYLFYDDYYNKLLEEYKNIEIYYLLSCLVSSIIAFIEYLVGYKTKNKKEENTEDEEVIKIHENKTIIKNDEKIDNLLIYLEMMDEPLACLVNDEYIINNKMKRILKADDYIIHKQKFYTFIDPSDRNCFFNRNDDSTFRLNVNNSDWYEETSVSIKNNQYQLIRQSKNSSSNKVRLKTFKELTNLINTYEKEDKDYYLIFFDIINTKDIESFYGKDFMELVVSKYLKDVYNLPYIFQIKMYYISFTEYAIILDDEVEYNILLSELENKTSIILKDEISISNNKIIIKSKIGVVASNEVSNENVLNKGFEMVKLACSEDYPNDYAIYYETDDDMEYNLQDYNIDLDIDLSQYQKKMK